MRTSFRLAAIVAATATLSAAPARADQIALTGGILDLQVFSGTLAGGLISVIGDRGFTFTGSMSGAFDEPVGNPMVPGTSIALRGGASGLGVGGAVTLDGVTYSPVGTLDSTAFVSVEIATLPAMLPLVLNASSAITAPMMLGLLFSVDGQFSHTLFGTGTATIFLGEDRGFGVPSWRVTGLGADLSTAQSPVPEPAAILLVGSGLAWAAVRRRRAARVATTSAARASHGSSGC
jgi:hypothetical protein